MKASKKDISSKLAGLLIQIHEGKNRPLIRRQASQLLSRIRPNDIAKAEHRLLKSGFSAEQVQQLCAAFVLMGVMETGKADLVRRLPDSHILRKVAAEHDLFRCFLADLEEVAAEIDRQSSLSAASPELMRLSHILEHLQGMAEHIAREDDVIFPMLKKQGWETLCRSIEKEHLYLQIAIEDLLKLRMAFQNMSFGVFKNQLTSLVRYIGPAMREHLFREEYVLFALALTAAQESSLWETMKTVCREIDYCGFHV
ncbi:MAG TPA: DUF438 domain-containing protein [Anaerohalosphaeraceae bacterium]|nr:DUF438 domain-containing protein [Anaerohalosphaeraceae bacterium]HOL88504.1 DUF438 domain-containing protein [Anaerohalosphaeraceae bacterium]HPP56526.1 DUF438 domain-containing protein [Anaerohalosphaeraceae bacterium]